ncbi:hypothetical protein MBANPS3_003969 [Mucor bainieri]
MRSSIPPVAMASEADITGKKIFVVTSVVQFNHDDIKKDNVITRSFSTEEKARSYMYQHAKDMYWEHMECPDEDFDEEDDEEKECDDTPDPDGYNRCFREVKKNNTYIMRTESYDGSFIQHNRALVKMDILLVDQGVYVKPIRAKKTTATKKRKIQANDYLPINAL